MISVFLIGCQNSPAKEVKDGSAQSKERLKVVSTIGMIHDAVKQIGADSVDASALMGPGIDPHLYRATASDVGKLNDADLVLYLGLELEGKMTDIFSKMGSSGKKAIALGESIDKSDLISLVGSEKAHDPHIWFDPELWKEVVEAVSKALVEAIPDDAENITQRTTAYLDQISKVDQEAKLKMESLDPERRILITAHDAFEYFGRRYGFEVVGIQGTSTASEASAKKLSELADLIAERQVKAIFVESSVPRNTIEALQSAVRDRGFEVTIGGSLYSDAMGNEGTPDGTYLGMFKHNVDTIIKALK